MQGIREIERSRHGCSAGRWWGGAGKGECGGDLADEIHVSVRLAAHDKRLALRKPTKQDQSALVMLDQFHAVTGAAAAAKFGGGADGGMGEHEHAGRRWKVFSCGGHEMTAIISDEGGLDAGDLKE